MKPLEQQGPPWGVLGLGYVGKAFAQKTHCPVVTQRCPQHASTLAFDLGNRATWPQVVKALEDVKAILWTFPAGSPDLDICLARDFASHLVGKPLFVLGTTSRYQAPDPGAWVNEETPVQPSPRSDAEAKLMAECGATVLALSGIWGPNREPLHWLQRGLIPSGQGLINLIHVEDICDIIEGLYPLSDKLAGQNINLTATPQLWGDVVQKLQRLGLLGTDFMFPKPAPGPTGKRVSNSRLRKLLPHIVPLEYPMTGLTKR